MSTRIGAGEGLADNSASDTVAIDSSSAPLEGEGQRPREQPASLAAGTMLGRYRILALVGSGGMGEVYAATDLDLDRRVALKILRGGRGGRNAAQRLLREAKAMARIVHPNVMTVHEVGSERGVDFVVMEFVEGIDLRAWAQTQPAWREVVSVFAAAGRGVAAAHAAGMIHRDLKPANILKASDGRVLVTDFGVVRLRDSNEAESPPSDPDPDAAPPTNGLTETGTFMGTPAYAAPEQFTGSATEKSDQYSLCASMYAVLVGHPPHGRHPDAAEVRRRVAPPTAKDHPRWLWTVIARGLEPNPRDRYPSVNALVVALSRRTRRRSASILLAASAVGLVAAWTIYPAGDDTANPCRPRQRLVEWHNNRDRLAEADWGGPGGPGSPAFERFAARMDEYADAWSDSWLDACEATHVRHVQTSAVLQTRMACLRHREQRVLGVLDGLATPEPRALQWAMQASFTLPAIAECNEASDGLSLPLPSPSIADAVEAIRTRIVAIEAGLPTLLLDDTIVESERLVEDARATGFAPLIAEALLARGQTLGVAKRPAEARTVLEEAALVAEECGHHRIYAHAMVSLVDNETTLWNGPDQFEARLRRARLAVGSYGYEALDTDLDQAQADALGRSGDLRGAVKLLRGVVARRRSMLTPNPNRIADSQMRLGAALGDLGQGDEAVEVLEAALERLLSAHGVETQSSVEARNMLARELRQQGRWLDARTHTIALEAFLATAPGLSLVEAVFAPWTDRIERDRAQKTEVRVIDAAGLARPDADVVAARTIVGDGAFAAAGDLTWWVQSGASRALTDARGNATLRHPQDPVWLIAEHETGRSWPVRIDDAKQGAVEVQLRPWSALHGVVDVSRPGVTGAIVHVFPRDLAAGRQVEFVLTADAEGRFDAPRLAVGAYIVGIQVQWDDGTRLVYRVDHTLTENDPSPVRLEIAVAPTSLQVQLVSAPTDATRDAAVFVVSGAMQASTVATFDIALVEAVRNGPMAVGSTRGGILELHGLPLGAYTMCLIPDTGSDGDLQARLAAVLRERDTPVQCSPIDIALPATHLAIAASSTAFRFPEQD